MVRYTAHEQYGVFCYENVVTVDKRLKYQPYAQAGIRFNNGITELISYTTVVLILDENGILKCTGLYSMTTRKHISSFLKEFCPNISFQDVKYAYNNGFDIDTINKKFI